jgi:cytochrome c biogenesis protein CcdA
VTLVFIGLVGGIITGLSPCVLPVLPVVFLGGGSAGPNAAVTSARRRPYLIVGGLTLSFAVFTLCGSLILSSLHLPDDAIRWLGLALLVLVGLGLLVPPLGHLLERPFYRFPQRVSGTGRNGFVLGVALGAVFVPCAARSWPPSPWPALPVTSARARSVSPWASPSAPRYRCSPSRSRGAA